VHMQTLTTEKRLSAILAANPDTLRRVDRILSGEPIEGATEPTDRRLLSIAQAARALNVSRTTVWRLLRDGGLPCVEIRPGSRRVPSAAVTAFARKGHCA
jgi:excisionase family DNA binding protein